MTEPAAPEEKVAPTVEVLGIPARPNPLRNFISSTYRISLGIFTIDTLNKFAGGDFEGTNKNILIASGGIPTNQRAKYFETDFYIDDLQIDGVMGLNSTTRGANTTAISFNIYEPNGFTLFNRLYNICAESEIGSYVDTPYFLKIKFQGYNDISNDHSPIALAPEFIIPIKITKIRTAVSAKGTEYAVEAITYYDSALLGREISVKPNIDITGKTVGELLEQFGQAINNFNSLAYRNTVNPFGGSDNDVDTIEFVVDESIAKASAFAEPLEQVPSTKTNMPSDLNQRLEMFKDKPIAVPLDENRYRIPNGTNIIDVIGSIVNKSSYVSSQIVNTSEYQEVIKSTDEKKKKEAQEKLEKTLNAKLNWYLVRPKVIIKRYDKKLKKYIKHIQYRIKRYNASNGRDPNFPGWGRADPIKDYQYIFTGKNEDVLDLQLNFDSLYHHIMLVAPEKNLMTAGLPQNSTETSQREALTQIFPSVDKDSAVMPAPIVATAGNAGTAYGSNSRNSQVQKADTLVTNLLTNSTSDMVSVKIDIIGDPEYLTGYNEKEFEEANQELLRSLTSPTKSTTADKTKEKEKAFRMVSLGNLDTEINCSLSFRTPQDYDIETGMMVTSKSPGYVRSLFDGVYKVTMVKSTFTGGVFRQQLTCVRLFNQTELRALEIAAEETSNDNSQVENRSATGDTNASVKDAPSL